MSPVGNKGDLFQAVERRESLSDRVAGELQRLISESQLDAGDRLPPERTLADRFNVSRTVVREAVRDLVARGLLEVRTGSGTTVSSPEPSSVGGFMSSLLGLSLRSGKLDHKKVVEVRRMLEVEIAGVAAGRRTEEDLASLREIVRRAEENLGDPDVFVETDIAFHEALAVATQNELFLVLLNSIADVLIEGRRLALRVEETASRAQAHHRNVLDRVTAGDAQGARDAMHSHMDEARDTMQRAFESRDRA